MCCVFRVVYYAHGRSQEFFLEGQELRRHIDVNIETSKRRGERIWGGVSPTLPIRRSRDSIRGLGSVESSPSGAPAEPPPPENWFYFYGIMFSLFFLRTFLQNATRSISRFAVDMKFSIHIHIHIHRFFRGYHGNIHGYIHGYTHGLPIACLWLPTCKIATTIPRSTTGGRASYQNDHDAGIPF